MGDHELKSQVEAAIRSRPNLASAQVAADVYDGRVLLVGDVDTLSQETQALLAAKSIPGVREVLSALQVAELEGAETEEVDDATLKSQIEAALIDHGVVIHGEGVVVSKGDVYLRGQVSSPRLKTKAEHIATTVSGVQGVHNELGVGAQGPGASRL